MPAGVGEGLTFGLVSFIFMAAAAWLFFQTLQGDMESTQAGLIFLPILVCWIGFGSALHSSPALAGGFFILAVVWCFMAAIRVMAVNERIKRDLRVSEIQHAQAWLMQHPNDGIGHMRLGDLFEQHGLLSEAYTEYVAVTTLDPRNKHAVLRARDAYRELTKKPSAKNANLPPLPEMPPEGPPPPPPEVEQPGRIKEFMGAIQRDPSNASLHASLAEEMLKHGRLQEAAEAYRKALWIDPSNERYRFNYHSLMEPAAEIGPAPAYGDPGESAEQPIDQAGKTQTVEARTESTQKVEPHTESTQKVEARTELFASPLVNEPSLAPPPELEFEDRLIAGVEAVTVPPRLNLLGSDEGSEKPAAPGPGGFKTKRLKLKERATGKVRSIKEKRAFDPDSDSQ
ncbi:MAG TPA: hypothetical protein VFJ58_10725 [Armatimonadota bacterium]|nr:hypothetical protein [Armatimonadota bacterium]